MMRELKWPSCRHVERPRTNSIFCFPEAWAANSKTIRWTLSQAVKVRRVGQSKHLLPTSQCVNRRIMHLVYQNKETSYFEGQCRFGSRGGMN